MKKKCWANHTLMGYAGGAIRGRELQLEKWLDEAYFIFEPGFPPFPLLLT